MTNRSDASQLAAHASPAEPVTAPEAPVDGLGSSVASARHRAAEALLAQQRRDGHWCAELEGDTILESEYILTLYFLGRAGEERVRKAANYLRSHQLADGGWATYPGGDADVSATVKAYFVLKLLGDDPESEPMRRAREAARRLGGLDACNSFTKLYLSIFGQYDWRHCPAVPPEMILLPKWFPINIYRMSSWSRAIVVPLSLIWACRPRCEVPDSADLAELRVAGSNPHYFRENRSLWVLIFEAINATLKLFDRLRLRPLRARAVRRAERWILERLEKSDGLGAIFPPIINTLIAFRCLGYPDDHPQVVRQHRELAKLELHEADTVRIQPCFSPVWDTALALNSLLEAGMPADDPAVLQATAWLLDHEVREVGDWAVRNPGVEPGGWYFEYANEFYPDCDDTAEVLTALSKVRPRDAETRRALEATRQRALRWLLSMQNRDGGWASFDRDCDDEFLTSIPFADHNAMIDPSTTDITGRVLECLAALGYDLSFEPARRAVEFIRREQEPDGSWYGRWGCNYLYGTWLALWGLRSIGEEMSRPYCQRAAEWLLGVQNSDGGWGELPRSYDDPSTKGQGPSTAAQTAWALMGLMAVGDTGSRAVRRGVEYLLAAQREDGTWQDEHWTGTGFPRVFYLRYHLYATYFPLLALATYERSLVDRQGGVSKVA